MLRAPFSQAMQPTFAFSIHDIDAGGLARAFELPVAWLRSAFEDTDVTAAEPGHAEVRLSKTGHDVIVRGKVTARITLPCARCMSPAVFPVQGELALVLRPARPEHAAPKHAAQKHTSAGHAPSKEDARKPHGKDAPRANGHKKGHAHEEEEYEFSSDEADVDTFEGETVVLDGFLREAILLEAPSFPLCSEECPGIRPRPSPERSEPVIDPRLSPLRALKTKLMLAGSAPAPAASGAAEAPPDDASKPAPERPAGKAARPRIHAHRTKGTAGASRASKQAKTKKSPTRAK